jgi:hypothetical protein
MSLTNFVQILDKQYLGSINLSKKIIIIDKNVELRLNYDISNIKIINNLNNYNLEKFIIDSDKYYILDIIKNIINKNKIKKLVINEYYQIFNSLNFDNISSIFINLYNTCYYPNESNYNEIVVFINTFNNLIDIGLDLIEKENMKELYDMIKYKKIKNVSLNLYKINKRYPENIKYLIINNDHLNILKLEKFRFDFHYLIKLLLRSNITNLYLRYFEEKFYNIDNIIKYLKYNYIIETITFLYSDFGQTYKSSNDNFSDQESIIFSDNELQTEDENKFDKLNENMMIKQIFKRNKTRTKTIFTNYQIYDLILFFEM